MLFLADTGCRIGEAQAVRWVDLNLANVKVVIEASIDFQGQRGETKTRRS
jgi:integrase